MDGVLGKCLCCDTNRNRVGLDKNKCSWKLQYFLLLPSGLFLHTFQGICTPFGGSKGTKDVFTHFCRCLNVVFGSGEIIRMLLGVHFVHLYRIGCLVFFFLPKFGLGIVPMREIMTIRDGSRTFVTHLRALVEKVTHFPNHCPYPEISLKLLCQEILGFSRQLIRFHVLYVGRDHISHCFGYQVSWDLSATSLPFFKVLRQSCVKYFDSLLLIKPHFTLFLFI